MQCRSIPCFRSSVIIQIGLILSVLFLTSCIPPVVLPPPPPDQPVRLTQSERQSVFRRLEAAGFTPGPYHEWNTPQFYDALKRFQTKAKIPVTGVLDTTTYSTLLRLYDPGKTSEPPPQIPRTQPPANPAPPVGSAPLNIGDIAFAVEKCECSDISGDWIVFYRGVITDKRDKTVFLLLEERFGYRYHPGAEGVDDTDWWCVPTRKHCYSPVEFTHWNGQYAENQTVAFPADKVFGIQGTVGEVMYRYLQKNCNR